MVLSKERAEAEEQEAQKYAHAIRTVSIEFDWIEWNHAIIDRWSVTALERIKRRAWQIVDGR